MMNGMLDRQLLTQIVIIVTGCVGGWMVAVEPRISELRKLEAVTAQAPTHTAVLDQKHVQRLAKKIHQVRERIAHIEARNRFGQDPSQMYGLVLAIADEHNVTVRRLVADSATGPAGHEAIDQVTTFHMMAQGAYEPLANFLSALDDLDGFVRPVSLAIRPGNDNQRMVVTGEYAWQAVSFKLPSVLTMMTRTTP